MGSSADGGKLCAPGAYAAVPACSSDIPASLSASMCRGGKKKLLPCLLLPLGILPLGGHRGCLPSLPGHSTLREPNTRKVLINPAAEREEREWWAEAHPPPGARLSQAHPAPQTTLRGPWSLGQAEYQLEPLPLSAPSSEAKPSLQPQRHAPEAGGWRQLTFCNVPGDASQEHFAAVDRVLIVPWRELATPGTGSFIHSFDGREKRVRESLPCPGVKGSKKNWTGPRCSQAWAKETKPLHVHSGEDMTRSHSLKGPGPTAGRGREN